jgi:hypothetical protein
VNSVDASVLLFDLIAEQKISEAIARGELSNLPGEGRPLDLQDDALVPEDLRMACRILKNAGFVPPEVEMVREIGDLKRYIDTLAEGGARTRALRKLQLRRTRVEACALRRFGVHAGGSYYRRVLHRFK